MQKFKAEKISDLSEVFYAVMGGKPDSIKEIEAFLAKNPLKELIFTNDMNRILEFDGFFSDETVDSVYCLLPCKIPLANGKSWLMTPQAFRKLNSDRIRRPASRFIDIPLSKANTIFFTQFKDKIDELKMIYRQAEEKKTETAAKASSAPKVVEGAPVQKKKWKYIPIDELPPELQEKRREANRKHNITYRQVNRKEISQRRKQWRIDLKENDPEKLREYDRKLNKNRKERGYDKTYFQNNKEEIMRKARENPKTPGYKRKYRNKKRFQEKTGPKIMALLSGIIAAKNR